MSNAGLGNVAREPQWVITYSGVNITADISSMVLGVAYTGYVGGEAGEIKVEINDQRRLWQDHWLPELGDMVNVMIGYQGEQLLPCGDFQVDDLELAGPPDTMHLRCLAAYITPAMRTVNTVGYENQSVMGITQKIANKYGLALSSAPGMSDIRYARITQCQETDLEFLNRLAREHDYDFTVRGPTLAFHARGALDSQRPAGTITRQNVERFEFRHRTHSVYHGSQVSYHDPDTKSLIARSVRVPGSVAPGDQLRIVSRCENGQQAAVKAAAALHLHDMIVIEGSLSGPGDIAYSAGNVIALSGWGKFDGNYLIQTAHHRLSRTSGYSAELEVRSAA